MDANFYIALIAPIAALLGVLASPLVSFLLEKLNHTSNMRENIRNKRQQIYYEFMNCMHDYIQKRDSDKFTLFFNAYSTLTLIGSPGVVFLVEKYLSDLNNCLLNGQQCSREEHNKYQEEIVNAMRKDMGLPENDIVKWLPLPLSIYENEKENNK